MTHGSYSFLGEMTVKMKRFGKILENNDRYIYRVKTLDKSMTNLTSRLFFN